MSEQEAPEGGVQPAIRLVQHDEGHGTMRTVMLGAGTSILVEFEEETPGEPVIVIDVPSWMSQSELAQAFEYIAHVLEHGMVEGGDGS